MELTEECMICFENFSIVHRPQILPCKHSVCSVCLPGIKSTHEICPYCRQTFIYSDIKPNVQFYDKILQELITELKGVRIDLFSKVEELANTEIKKHIEVISQLDSINEFIISLFAAARSEIEKIIKGNNQKKIKFMQDFDRELSQITCETSDLDKTYKIITDLKSKYLHPELSLTLNNFNTKKFTENINSLSQRAITLIAFESQLEKFSVFSKGTLSLNLTSTKQKRNQFVSMNLFDPLPGLLNIYNMNIQDIIPIEEPLITSNSICYQLHPNTVCVVTPKDLLYIDISKKEIYHVGLNKQITGFCLGRYEGDLMIIGGEEEGCEKYNKRKVYLRLKRQKWIVKRTLRKHRVNATSESVHNKIYVFGGNPDCSIEFFYQDAWNNLNVKLMGAWSRIVSCCSEYDIYLLGGEGYTEKSNVIYKFDINRFEITRVDEITENVAKNFNCSAAWANGNIYYNVGEKLYVYSFH